MEYGDPTIANECRIPLGLLGSIVTSPVQGSLGTSDLAAHAGRASMTLLFAHGDLGRETHLPKGQTTVVWLGSWVEGYFHDRMCAANCLRAQGSFAKGDGLPRAYLLTPFDKIESNSPGSPSTYVFLCCFCLDLRLCLEDTLCSQARGSDMQTRRLTAYFLGTSKLVSNRSSRQEHINTQKVLGQKWGPALLQDMH